jgi:hypothetical protein
LTQNTIEQISTNESDMKKPLRPSQCRGHMRRELAKEFPKIVTGFIEQAKSGSCVHVKLANELLAPVPKRRTRKHNAAGQFLAELMQQEASAGE